MSLLDERTELLEPEDTVDTVDTAAPDGEVGVTLRRRRLALALVGAGALAVAGAYLWRAVGGGSPVGYLVAAVMLPVAVLHLAAWWDARVPLLVADRTGLRLREGKSWTGLRWDQASVLRMTTARLPRRDGRLVVEGTDGVVRTLPLAMVDPADLRRLPDTLRQLTGGRADIVVDVREPEPDPEPEPVPTVEPAAGPDPQPDPRPEPTAGTRVVIADPEADLPADPPTQIEPRRELGPDPLQTRELAEEAPPVRRVGVVLPRADVARADVARADVIHESVHRPVGSGQAQPGESALRDAAPGRVGLVLETGGAQAAAPRAEQATTRSPVDSMAADPVPAADIDSDIDPGVDPVTDPVIGPELAAARARLRLSVDELADRTRIRPHVIEAIEVDDFSACGGDVYARGHVRSLARMVGIDPDPLVRAYDERYASAPVTARRVFEAELAGPGRALRRTSGGPRWAVLAVAVLVLLLVWSLARLLVPPPADPDDDPGTRSGAPSSAARPNADPATTAERFAGMGQRTAVTELALTASPEATGATPVVVRAADGTVVFRGTVGPGQPRTVQIAGPATVTTPNAGAVAAQVDGQATGPLGVAGESVTTTLGG